MTNQFFDDTFQRCYHCKGWEVLSDRLFTDRLAVFLPNDIASANEPEVATLAQEVISPRVFAWVTDSERNAPYLKGSGRDAFGSWTGELVTGEGWRELQRFGQAKG